MKKHLFGLLFILFPFYPSLAQQSGGEILLGIEKTGTIGSVLYIAAHPDDENTRLLTWLSKEKGYRTSYLSLTRGDGGQNLIGKEQGDLLGVIRTRELLRARDTDGAEQYFTRARDFGYSKNPEETFRIWNKDSVLSDVVWVIRNLKPDVIICRFPSTGEGGHGHHTASAILAEEAFDAAADPKMFPEQLRFTDTWQPSALFWNTFNFGGRNTTSEDQLKIDVGGYNPLLGQSYGEISAASRSMHKSQGFGTVSSRGTQIEYLKQLKGKPVKDELFEHIGDDWSRLNAHHINRIVDSLSRNFNYRNPSQIIPGLIQLKNEINALPSRDSLTTYWMRLKSKEVTDLILDAAGIYISATTDADFGVPGENIELKTQLIVRGNQSIKLNTLTWPDQEKEEGSGELETNKLYTFNHLYTVPEDIDYTSPYWLNSGGTFGALSVPEYQLRGLPENPERQYIRAELTISDQTLLTTVPLRYIYSDPVRGEVNEPFNIIPVVTVSFSENIYLFHQTIPRTIRLTITAHKDSAAGTIQVNAGDGWKVEMHPSYKEFFIPRKGEEKVVEAIIVPNKKESLANITASVSSNGNTYNQTLTRVNYDHIPEQVVLNTAESRLVYVDLKKEGQRVGYIPGAGDDIPSVLQQIGYDVTILDESLLSSRDLSRFDAIVTGIRAFNTNEWLIAYQSKLLNYVEEGGNLLIQYNTNNRLGPLETTFAPYPFTITRNRVTDESATVKFDDPASKALNYPNKISQTDFENWVQERGIYFAGDIDPRYQTPLLMNDPGEDPQSGSLIIGPYGKGNFIYTGLSFFRELPAGVPGAYRLFVNLLSLPENEVK